MGPDTGSPAVGVDSYVPAMLADPSLMPHVLQFGFHTYGSTVSDPAITNNATYPGRHILSDEYDGPYYNEDHGQRATPAQLWAQADASFQNLVSLVNAGENGATIWDGVSNPVALRNLRGMQSGDRLILYHTGDDKSAVGTATVVSVDAADRKNPQVKIKAGKPLPKPVSLAQIKSNPLFADSPLVRQGRLSVVPLTPAQYKSLTG